MEKLLFTLVLVLLAGVISLLTGRNRRQLEKVPEGMAILCQPPGKRYLLYALGVFVFGFVMFFSVLFVMDGAPENARFMWGLCVAFAVLTLIVCIAGGNMMALDCVYFDGEKLQINKPFRKPQVFQWHEICKMTGSFDSTVNLYLLDGTKILTVGIGMVNHQLFFAMLKAKRPEIAAGYYREQRYDSPQKCVLRYGAEYYLLAVMGVLFLVLWLALYASSPDNGELLEMILQHGPDGWFSVLFAPVCGVVGLIALFVLCNTNVRYSREKMVLKYPLRGRREVYWKDIQQIEVTRKWNQEKRKVWTTLRICTEDGVYKINLALLTQGKDAFMTKLFQRVEQYDISCVEKEK